MSEAGGRRWHPKSDFILLGGECEARGDRCNCDWWFWIRLTIYGVPLVSTVQSNSLVHLVKFSLSSGRLRFEGAVCIMVEGKKEGEGQ